LTLTVGASQLTAIRKDIQAMSRPLGLMTIWRTKEDGKVEIAQTGLFDYYQNGHDYLTQYAQAKGWETDVTFGRESIAFRTGAYRIELSLVETKGLDLSKETYLFQETTDAEAHHD
jgi:hypothetical protein